MSAKPFVLGGLASLAAEFGTFPIDTTKTRLQIQGQAVERVWRSCRYKGMMDAFLKISKEEGIKALYRGVVPALLRQASYGTLKIGCYHSIKGVITPNPDKETLLTNVFAGIISGAFASAVANPTDVLKVRMQACTSHAGLTIPATQTGSVITAFANIYRMEGLRGLYRGVGPTTQRAAVVAGVLLPTYDLSKKYLLNHTHLQDTPTTHFLSSFVASFVAAVASNPIDVVKTRMMNQKVTNPHLYKSSLDCFLKTLSFEGPLALYKGFVPSYLRLGPWNIIFFVTYEQLKVLF